MSAFTESTRIRRRSRLASAAALPLAAVLVGCSSDLPQNALAPQGPEAQQTHDLIVPVFVIAGVILVLVLGLTVAFALKFRAKSGDEDKPVKQVEGNTRAEIGWTIAPALILLGVGIFTLIVLIDINRRDEGAPLTAQAVVASGEGESAAVAIQEKVLQVDVIGHQWWWEFQYPGYFGADGVNVTVANEMVIPTGVTIEVNLRSSGVIHSFWVPRLAGKVDAIPSRENFLKLEATEPGVYYGQCAEFCGISHANMRLRVVALEPLAYAAWMERQALDAPVPNATTDPDAFAGYRLFISRGCAGCHAVSGYANGNLGPNLTHLYDREVFAGAIFQLNDANMRKWLRNPQLEKPGTLMILPQVLTEEEIDQLIAYMETLRSVDESGQPLPTTAALSRGTSAEPQE